MFVLGYNLEYHLDGMETIPQFIQGQDGGNNINPAYTKFVQHATRNTLFTDIIFFFGKSIFYVSKK